MRNYNKILSLVLLMGLNLNTYSMQNKDKSPRFFGRIMKTEARGADSLKISYWKECLWGTHGVSSFFVKIDSAGKFHFKLPETSAPIKMRFMIYISGNIRILNDFYVEPNDSVELKIINRLKTDSVNFYGKGSAKYDIISKLVKQHESFINCVTILKPYMFTDSVSLKKKLQLINDLVINYTEDKNDLLKSINLNEDIKKLLNYEYNNYYSYWNVILNEMYRKGASGNSSLQLIIHQYYTHNNSNFSYKYDNIIYLAPKYLSSLLFSTKFKLFMSGNGETVDLKQLFGALRDNYTGIVRQRLLFDFFLNPYTFQYTRYNQNVYDSLLNEANKLITANHLADIINSKSKIKKGIALLNSEFTDLKDKKFDTKALLGKVFILDIWGVGCTGCAIFHKMFEKKVYPLIRNNPKFTYLSISIDKSKEQWIRGIKSQHYTSENYINVFTGGLEIAHPFIKYYNIHGIPFILLVDDKGRIFTKIDALSDPDEIFKLINMALNQKETR